MVSSTLGSSTITGWNRRSSAASFSMYLRYSSRVVAPMVRSSPRASCGLSMFEASTAPSAAPAPTMVCSSSMKRITSPWESVTSLRKAFSRSSNSPRNLAPASIEPMSMATMRLFLSDSGTSPLTMRRARPSTMAVLPTPGVADENRVVLRAPREHLHHPANFVIASDYRVDLSSPGRLGKVAPVFLERLVFSLRILVGDPLTSPHLLERLEEPRVRHAGILRASSRPAHWIRSAPADNARR